MTNATDSNDGKRITKACQLCASRRRRCDGQYPRCSMCQRVGVECRYIDSGKKRGRPSNASRQWRDAAQQDADNATEADAGDQEGARLRRRVDHDVRRVSTIASGNGRTDRPTWPASVTSNARAGAAISSENRPARHGSPPTRPSVEAVWAIPAAPTVTATTTRYPSHSHRIGLQPNRGEYSSPRARTSIEDHRKDALDHLTSLLHGLEASDRRWSSLMPLKTLAPAKVRYHFDIFWRHVHSHWQILYKPGIVSIPETRLAEAVKQPLFDAIICLTATMAANTERDRSTVESICQLATNDVLSQLLTPRLSVIQALFLHALRFYGIGDLKKASMFTSCAWQMCIDLNLHTDDRSVQRDPGKHQERLRALWTCYCLDKFIAAEMERVPAFRSDGVTAELLSEFEPDEFEIVYQTSDLAAVDQSAQAVTLGRLHAASSLNLTVRTYRILEQALLSPVLLHSDPAMLERELLAAWNRSLSLDRNLDELAASWPDQFRLHSRNGLAVPGVACLVISFHLIKIINYRPYLLLQDRLFRATNDDSEVGPSAQIAAMCCLSSASAIVQLFGSIPRASLRYIAANNAFAIFTAASILMPYASHDSLAIAKECHESVIRCFAWLDEMAQTWPIARKHRAALDDLARLMQIPIEQPRWDSTTNDGQNRGEGHARDHAAARGSAMASSNGFHGQPPLARPMTHDGAARRSLAEPTPPTQLRSPHNEDTSPLGFRGQLALRPFATSTGTTTTSLLDGSATGAQNVRHQGNGGDGGSRSVPEPRQGMSRSHPTPSTSITAMPMAHTAATELPNDLLNFLDADSDAATWLDELCLDPSIQALVRQSLSRDTSLWDPSVAEVM